MLFASSAVIWISKEVPAVCVPMAPPPTASTTKWSRAPGSTVKEFVTPVSVPVPRPTAMKKPTSQRTPTTGGMIAAFVPTSFIGYAWIGKQASLCTLKALRFTVQR